MDSTPDNLSIVVEGVGEIVEERYAPALFSQYERALRKSKTLRVTFTDESQYWDHDSTPDAIRLRRKAFIRAVKKWATYVDKSTRTGPKKYSSLTADVVLIATPDHTHVSIALAWIARPGSCKHLFIEKPLDSSLRRARTLDYYAKFSDTIIYPLDHYLARVLPLANPATILGLLKYIGGKLTRVDYYLLENHKEPFSGPIESHARVATLSQGLILDLFPHVLAVLNLFGRIDTIDVTKLKIARYSFASLGGEFVDSEIPKETFAEIRFSMKSLTRNDRFDVNSYVGKGISGSITFPEIQSEHLKKIVLFGTNKNKVVIDLGQRGTVEVCNSKGKVISVGPSLIEDPYEAIVSKIVGSFLWKREEKLAFVIKLRDAKHTLSCIHDLMTLVQNFLNSGSAIPTYQIKTLGEPPGGVSPLLEEVSASVMSVNDEITISKVAQLYAGKDGLLVDQAMHEMPN